MSIHAGRRTLDIATNNQLDLITIWLAVTAIIEYKSDSPHCYAGTPYQFISWSFSRKVEDICQTTGFTRNTLILLAMVKTAREIGDEFVEKKLTDLIARRYTPSSKFYYCVNSIAIRCAF